MDILSETLRMLDLSGSLLARAGLSAPWGLELPTDEVAYFHVVARGTCVIENNAGEVTKLDHGDIAVLPSGSGHVIKDVVGSTVNSCPEFKAVGTACPNLRIDGGGQHTELICGQFRLRRPEIQPLFSLLPATIHLKAGQRHADAWLEATIGLLTNETANPSPGQEAFIDRILGVLFIQVIRSYAEQIPDGEKSWLAGMNDPIVGDALAIIHRSPEMAHSLGALATEIGISRSALASKFKAAVGDSPMAYATRWRVQVAAQLLETEQLSVSQIAERLGYELESTFSRAFKRVTGLSPSNYRVSATESTQ